MRKLRNQDVECYPLLPTGLVPRDWQPVFDIFNRFRVQRGLAVFLAQAIDGRKVGDCQQPILEIPFVGVPLGGLPPHFQEGILRHFLSQCGVLENMIRQTVNGASILLVDRKKRLLVACGNTLHEINIVKS